MSRYRANARKIFLKIEHSWQYLLVFVAEENITFAAKCDQPASGLDQLLRHRTDKRTGAASSTKNLTLVIALLAKPSIWSAFVCVLKSLLESCSPEEIREPLGLF